jgi:hypothetical protein
MDELDDEDQRRLYAILRRYNVQYTRSFDLAWYDPVHDEGEELAEMAH